MKNIIGQYLFYEKIGDKYYCWILNNAKPHILDLDSANFVTSELSSVKEFANTIENPVAKPKMRGSLTPYFNLPIIFKNRKKVYKSSKIGNELEIVKEYVDNQPTSLRKVGKKFGISYERVRQILEKNGVNPLSIKKPYHFGERCRLCKRKFDNDKVKYAAKGYCKSCYNYLIERKNKNPVNKYLRNIKYPKYCKICGKKLVVGKRRKGLCNTCYHRLYRKNQLDKIEKKV